MYLVAVKETIGKDFSCYKSIITWVLYSFIVSKYMFTCTRSSFILKLKKIKESHRSNVRRAVHLFTNII